MEIAIFIAIAVLIIAFAVWGHIQEKQRSEDLARFASAQGWHFSREKERGLAELFYKVSTFNTGHSRYAWNVMRGNFSNESVEVFDYHYAITTSNGKSSSTKHYYYSCYVVRLPKSFGWLNVEHEGFMSKLAQAFGYDDIDFESAEFSKKYCVRAQDKKFAYGILHSQMMEYLLARPGMYFYISGDRLMTYFSGKLSPEVIMSRLKYLIDIRLHFPEYLLSR
ncbi:MAG: DUF3137 domain-containing protein [Puniceicoccales bacterium]|jgi:hypothetical protein|nr:DUF3137 domain-containing protein [Puniceicoccales bacterium]